MFENQNVIVTGGSSGFGLALARELVAGGARVGLVARNAQRLEAARVELEGARPGAVVRTRAVDVADEAAVRPAFAALAAELGGLDVLVNSAGILHEGYFETLSADVFKKTMDVDFFGALHATQAALPLLERARGRLVNVASVAGLTGVFGYTAYCAAKHALVGWSEALRYELAPKGVRVHLVCPPEFDSPMVDALDSYRTPENREHTLTIPKSPVDAIVKDTLAGIRKERFLIVPTARARAAALGIRLFPGLTRSVGDARIRKARAKG